MLLRFAPGIGNILGNSLISSQILNLVKEPIKQLVVTAVKKIVPAVKSIAKRIYNTVKKAFNWQKN